MTLLLIALLDTKTDCDSFAIAGALVAVMCAVVPLNIVLCYLCHFLSVSASLARKTPFTHGKTDGMPPPTRGYELRPSVCPSVRPV